MAALSGAYVDLPLATLQTMQTETLAAISAAKKAGVAYAMSGRSKQSASLPDLMQDLNEINYAIGLQGGTRVNHTYLDMSNG